MNKREVSWDDIEQVRYIASMLAELDKMAQRIKQAELSLLIGVAALAAVELETDFTSICDLEPS